MISPESLLQVGIPVPGELLVAQVAAPEGVGQRLALAESLLPWAAVAAVMNEGIRVES